MSSDGSIDLGDPSLTPVESVENCPDTAAVGGEGVARRWLLNAVRCMVQPERLEVLAVWVCAGICGDSSSGQLADR